MRYVGDAIEKADAQKLSAKVLTTGHRIDGRDTKPFVHTVRSRCLAHVPMVRRCFTRRNPGNGRYDAGTGEDAQVSTV